MYLDCFPALNNVEARVGSNSSASTTRENWANASDNFPYGEYRPAIVIDLVVLIPVVAVIGL